MTKLTDIYGHELNAGPLASDIAGGRTSGAVVGLDAAGLSQAWGEAAGALLAHKASFAGNLDTVLANAPEFAYALAVKGIGCLLLGRRELVAGAAAAYAQARVAVETHDVSQSERLVVKALGMLLADRWRAAADLLDQALHLSPLDALLVKLSHGVRFILGDARGMRRTIEAVLSGYDEAHPHAGYVYGCYAFGLEETSEYAEAERWGRRGLELNPDDAWGLHAVAHVYEMRVDPQAGQRWLMDYKPAWQGSNNFKVHVWWHMALFMLEQGDEAGVLELYDREIRADQTDDYRDIANGASMLSRLTLEGVDVGERWEELADKSANRIDDACLAFADLHYLLSLIGAGRMVEAEQLVARMARTAENNMGDTGVVARRSSAPMGRALLEYARGNYQAALDVFKPAGDQLYRVGGSHAQRDVFKRIMTDAAIAAGALDTARTILKERATLRCGADRFSKDRMAAARYSITSPKPSKPGVIDGDRMFG